MPGTLLIGDSQAVGLFRPLAEAGLPLVGLVAHAGISTTGLASSGDVGAAVRAFSPDLVLVILGGNDSAGPALEHAIADLRQQLPVNVVWVGPMASSDLDVDTRHARTGATQRGLARSLRYQWIDGRPLSLDLVHTHDGVHFTAQAYATLARRIAAQLRSTTVAARWGWTLGLTAAVSAAIAGAAWIWSRA